MLEIKDEQLVKMNRLITSALSDTIRSEKTVRVHLAALKGSHSYQNIDLVELQSNCSAELVRSSAENKYRWGSHRPPIRWPVRKHQSSLEPSHVPPPKALKVPTEA